MQTVLSGTWATLSASAYGNRYGFQGGRFDQGLYIFNARDYSPTLGRWLERDPLSYGAGDMNDYRTEGNGPTGENKGVGTLCFIGNNPNKGS